MAGQPKQGLDFAAWDVHILDDDERFDVLIDAQGWSGFGVFFYICTKAYANNGYYYEWREKTSAAAIAKRMSGGIKSDMWASGRATGKSNAAREINRQLDDLRASDVYKRQ